MDHGFYTAHSEFVNNGYVVKAPHFTEKGKKYTTRQANENRLVTRVRYEVERANVRLKQFKLFDKTMLSLDIPKLKTDFTVAAALHNRFQFKQELQQDTRKSIETAEGMLKRVPMENDLFKIVNSKSFDKALKNSKYSRLQDFSIFPQLSLDNLKDLAFGNYQIHQSKLYSMRHLEENNNEFVVYRFDKKVVGEFFPNYDDKKPELLVFNIKSQFKADQTWRSYVLFIPTGKDEKKSTKNERKPEDGKSSILSYCCDCNVGMRTVGMCSHVMCILFYLGHAYYEKKVLKKAEHLKNIFDIENTFHN